MTEPNDIPAILARHDAAMKMSWGVFNIYPYLADVPNMAAEILSLRADKKRLDVLEEMLVAHSIQTASAGLEVYVAELGFFDTFAEAADAELSRREKENG